MSPVDPSGRSRFHPAFEVAEIPAELEALLGFSAKCGCGKTHSVDLRAASVRRGALEDTVELATEVGRGLSVAVVVDRVTKEVAGERLGSLLKADGHDVRVVEVPDGAGQRPHADEERLAFTVSALSGIDLAVAVGAGTINDLTKLASFRKDIPYITVATAPSMNGYTSAIAAIMQRGVKRTVECHQPYAVVADLDILKDAPLDLCRAGLGDLESKPTASADFRLGGALRNTYFCTAPEQVVLVAEERAAAAAEGLKHRDAEAIEALTHALILSGISMKIAGCSSPASGGEHLISHFWDMTADKEGRIEGWHGAQVGVATIVTATLFDRLRQVSPDDIDIDAVVASRVSWEVKEKSIRSRHGGFADEVLREWRAKQLSDGQLRQELGLVKRHWSELWQYLDDVLVPPSRIRKVLHAAGAPVGVRALGLTPRHLKEAIVAASEIRSRFTVLDFAVDLGVFDIIQESVLEASGCLGV